MSKEDTGVYHVKSSDGFTLDSYFNYYSKMSNQMVMLQDRVRTSLYRRALMANPPEFSGKTIMDVGAGSGVLSFFSAMAGAEKVIAVEASDIVHTLKLLLHGNPQLQPEKFRVVHKFLEDLTLDDLDSSELKCADTLVSEPIGTFLFNERMIETYLHARDLFLKDGGSMFPSRGRLVMQPFSDCSLYQDMISRAQFWSQRDYYGVDLSAALPRAVGEQFQQPVVDHLDPNVLMSKPNHSDFDFRTLQVADLKRMVIPLEYEFSQPGIMHGLAGWFDLAFDGSTDPIAFSTAPWCASTHWFQIMFLLLTPLAVNCGQRVTGNLTMTANNQQSYHIEIYLQVEGTSPLITSKSAMIDLKDPDFRYYSNPAASFVNSEAVPKEPQPVHVDEWEILLDQHKMSGNQHTSNCLGAEFK